MAAKEGKVGDNSNLNADETKKLRKYLSEIERVGQEIRELSSERAHIYKSAKDDGFDTPSLRETVKLRRMNADQLNARINTMDAYMHALGMLSDLPLGQAAMQRDGVGVSA